MEKPVVKISIAVGSGSVVEATMSAEAVFAFQQFIGEMKNADGSPKYSGVADLLIRHVRESLAVPLVQRYSAEVLAAKAAAEAAQQAAEAAATAAATGTVVVLP